VLDKATQINTAKVAVTIQRQNAQFGPENTAVFSFNVIRSEFHCPVVKPSAYKV